MTDRNVKDVTFKLDWSHEVQAAMRSFGVVQINVLAKIFNQVIEVVNRTVMEVFIFDDVIGTFQKSVVKTGVSHADPDFMLVEFLGVDQAPVLSASIGVMNEFEVEFCGCSDI